MSPGIKKILDFICTEKLAVVSTVDANGKPESAVIGFAETENLELIFGTPNTTRKYKNLQKNPSVAFTIGWDDVVHITIQYEGVAKELAGDDAKKYAEIMAIKIPQSRKFMLRADQRYFLVKPTWVRFSSQDEVFETTL